MKTEDDQLQEVQAQISCICKAKASFLFLSEIGKKNQRTNTILEQREKYFPNSSDNSKIKRFWEFLSLFTINIIYHMHDRDIKS